MMAAPLARIIHRFESLPSTNEEAKRLARAGAAHGEVVIADRQPAGKGRRGRSWLDLGGRNLFLSAILRPELPAAKAPRLVAVAAVSVAEALESLGLEARLKWPNDVEIQGKKVCGILLELAAKGEAIDFAVVGIGVNLEGRPEAFGEEVAERATTLERELGRRTDREEVLRRILDRLDHWQAFLGSQGFAPVRERYRFLSSTIGARVRMIESDRILEGLALDVDEDGALWVKDDEGREERFLSGDVVSLRSIG